MSKHTPGPWSRDDEATLDALSLIGIEVPVEKVRQWSDEQCRKAEDYALARHFRASDNANRVPPMPDHLRAAIAKAEGEPK